MLKKMTPDELQSIVRSAIQNAVSFIEDEIAPDRITAQRYFDGEVDLEAEDGRSTAVSTKCRDVVRAVKPSLMRVFLQTDKPVEFVPHGEEDVQAAEQATEYVSWLFSRSAGFRVLSDVFHDALVKKVGVAKVYREEAETQRIKTFEGIPTEQWAQITTPDNVEVLEHSEENGLHSVKVAITETRNNISVISVPPEEFFVDPDARSMDDYYVCGDTYEGRVADLLAMGFGYDEVEALDHEDSDLEEYEREKRHSSSDDALKDPSMRPVQITEAFMRVDIEGTGKPQLYKFICGGTSYKILRRDPVEEAPYAVFEVDPEPHAFFGRSLVDIVINDQTVATSLLRGAIDNTHLANNPSFALNDEKTAEYIDDWLSFEIGGLKRTQGAPQDAVMPVVVPSTTAATLPFMQYFDETVEVKSGVTRASAGLDPDALQSATATAVDATVRGANEQKEVIARNLAEGMKQLFRLLLAVSHRNPDEQTIMRLQGKFIPVSPDSWNLDMDMAVNVGLGTGNEDAKALVLRETLQNQMTIWAQGGGPQNGLVSMTNIRNTLADILDHAGMRNADRYYLPMDPQREQMALAAAQQGQQQPAQPDPTYVAGEQIKAQASLQKAQLDAQVKMQTEAMRDDRERDKDETDAILKAAELLGQYGIQVNQQQIDAMRDAPRMVLPG